MDNSQCSILWIEDVLSEIFNQISQLKELGFIITTCPNTDIAEKVLLAGNEFDLLILDSYISGSAGASHEGPAFFTRLRSTDFGAWGKSVPCIFVTNYSNSVARLTAGLTNQPVILDKADAPSKIVTRIVELNLQIVNGDTMSITNTNVTNSKLGGGIAIGNTDSAVAMGVQASAETAAKGLLAPHRDEIKSLINDLVTRDQSEVAGQLIPLLSEDAASESTRLQSFGEWLSTKGEEAKAGLATSASIVGISAALLRLLGIG